MDDAWKAVYEMRARSNMPDHLKSCWTKEGFEELLYLTLKFVDEIDSSEIGAGNDKIQSILDVGSGPGIYCNELFLKGYDVTGVDYSQEMINLSKQRFPHIRFIVGSGYDLKFEDKSFDMSISIGALQCLMDHEKFLRELCRVTKNHIILSTLWREDTGEDPQKILRMQLVDDSWPTREYHPKEIVPILESEGFMCKIIKENGGKDIMDGYFIIARKNVI